MKSFFVSLVSVLFVMGCASQSTTAKSEASKAEDAAKTATAATAADAQATAKSEVDAKAKAATEAAAGAVTCTHGKDVRTLSVEKTEAGGCDLQYNKGGTASSVANARAGVAHCEAVAQKIKSNLTASGFNCQ